MTTDLQKKIEALTAEITSLNQQLPNKPRPLTMASLKSLTREEINSRWDEVSQLIAQQKDSAHPKGDNTK